MRTICVPPKTGVLATTASPSTESSVLLLSTGLSSFTESRAATSRPSYVVPNRMRSGALPPLIASAIAVADGGAGEAAAEIAGGVHR